MRTGQLKTFKTFIWNRIDKLISVNKKIVPSGNVGQFQHNIELNPLEVCTETKAGCF